MLASTCRKKKTNNCGAIKASLLSTQKGPTTEHSEGVNPVPATKAKRFTEM